MGHHIVQSERGETLSIVLGGIILLELDDKFLENSSMISSMIWLGQSRSAFSQSITSFNYHQEAFEEWCKSLKEADFSDLRPVENDFLSRFEFDPFDPSTTPRGPSPLYGRGGRPLVHGHLPFAGQTTDDFVFYRCEPFPTSRSINRSTGEISVSGGLYGFPPSELQFVPSGFAAVGRYALPNVAPSIFRWQLKAPSGVDFSAGASVPLFGQAGGGVEVCMEKDFQNVGNVADPVVLPSL
ncbi:hypothetical protein [Sulfitobacter sp. HGT1]|uniref:hypothetical protein n=1 Tax=Sulfitobacter sp. HGT1 TaxID=2735435 RepID=UPI0015935D78|nr:hypothetical protein [Sulfitobacter sp. HGT1]